MKKYAPVFEAGICLGIIYCLIFEFGIIKKEIALCLDMWINIIVPSVFPYLVISRYITDSDIFCLFEKFPGKYSAGLLGISSCSIRAVICSLICGYPSGAICAKALYDKGEIKKAEAQRLISFTNNAGPLFLISAVGTGLMGCAKDGFAIYIIQLLSAFFYGLFTRKNSAGGAICSRRYNKTGGDLCDAVKGAVITTVNICGFMIAAYILSECVMIGIQRFCATDADITRISAFVKGFFEISAGVREISLLKPGGSGFAFVCACVSWSGLSVIMQIKSVAGDVISLKRLCAAKFVQAVMSFCLGYCYKNTEVIYNLKPENGYAIKISLIAAICLFMIYIFIQYKKKLSDKI